MGFFDKVKKGIHDIADDVKGAAEEGVEKAGDTLQNAFEKVEGFSLSSKVGKLGQKAKTRLHDLGDNIEDAIKDPAMKKILEDLATAALKENREVIDAMQEVGKEIVQCPTIYNDIENISKQLKNGMIDIIAIQNLKKIVSFDNYFGRGIQGGTFGVQASASMGFSVGCEVGIGINGNFQDTRGYIGPGIGIDIGGGGIGKGIEFGVWNVKPEDLAGNTVVIAFGAAYGVGAELQVLFDLEWKFLGFRMTFPNLGVEVEVSFSLAHTKTFGSFLAEYAA